jgi:hypothetical protein
MGFSSPKHILGWKHLQNEYQGGYRIFWIAIKQYKVIFLYQFTKMGFMNSNRRIQIAINLLREALHVLSQSRTEDYPRPHLLLVPKEELAVLQEIRDTTSKTYTLVQTVSGYTQKTLKSSCPGCDRDLMLIIDGANLILECYNPDTNKHKTRNINATKWKLKPIQVT